MHTFGCVVTLMSAVVLYLTHKNQMLLHQSLSRPWRWLSGSTLILGAGLLWLSLPKMVAILTWLIFVILVWSFIPFLGLIKKRVQHEQ